MMSASRFRPRTWKLPCAARVVGTPIVLQIEERCKFRPLCSSSATSSTNESSNVNEREEKRRSKSARSSFMEDFLSEKTEDGPANASSKSNRRGDEHTSTEPEREVVHRTPQQNNANNHARTNAQPKTACMVSMEEFAALERKLGGSNTKSKEMATALGPRKSLEEVAMAEFAAVEQKLAGPKLKGLAPFASRAKQRGQGSSILREPKAPEASECCGTGCANCVWIDYWERLREWEEAKGNAEREEAAR